MYAVRIEVVVAARGCQIAVRVARSSDTSAAITITRTSPIAFQLLFYADRVLACLQRQHGRGSRPPSRLRAASPRMRLHLGRRGHLAPPSQGRGHARPGGAAARLHRRGAAVTAGDEAAALTEDPAVVALAGGFPNATVSAEGMHTCGQAQVQPLHHACLSLNAPLQLLASSRVPALAAAKHFVNLTNGIEAIGTLDSLGLAYRCVITYTGHRPPSQQPAAAMCTPPPPPAPAAAPAAAACMPPRPHPSRPRTVLPGAAAASYA